MQIEYKLISFYPGPWEIEHDFFKCRLVKDA